MKYILMDYVNEAGWPQLTKDEKEHWLGAYRAYMEAMTKAGALRDSKGLQPTSAATTVRVANGKTQVLDGPYADSKEQLGGFHIIDVGSRCSNWVCSPLPNRTARRRRSASSPGGHTADQGHRRLHCYEPTC
jgi:hypothetical protein